VVQHFGLRVDDDFQTVFTALKVRDEHFYLASGSLLAYLADGFGKNLCAAHVVVIAIHAGDYGMLQTKGGHSFSHAARLVPIQRLRLAFGDSAKAATPSTQIAQQHERGGLMVPALANVRALGRFANRVQIQSSCQPLEIVVIVAHGRARLQPLRLLLRTPGRKIYLDEFYRAGH
jgi:hypothetical protein